MLVCFQIRVLATVDQYVASNQFSQAWRHTELYKFAVTTIWQRHNHPSEIVMTIGSNATEHACLLSYKTVDMISCQLPPCEHQHTCGEAGQHLPAGSNERQSPYANARHESCWHVRMQKSCMAVTVQYLMQLQQVTDHKNKPKHKPSTSTWAICEESAAHPNCLATPPMHLVVIASRRMSWCFLASPRASSQHCTFLLEVVAPPISRQLVTRTVCRRRRRLQADKQSDDVMARTQAIRL